MKKSFLLAVMLCCAQLLSAQQERIDLSGTWRFQTDPMGFGKTPGSELYQAKLTESILLPGSTDEGGKGMLTTARYVDRLISVKSLSPKSGKIKKSCSIWKDAIGRQQFM